MTCQSWRSRDLLSERGIGNTHARIFIRPPTLTGHSFKALGAMMMKSSSFESPKLYSSTLNSKKSIAALLTTVRTCWKLPIYYINVVLVIRIWTALYEILKFRIVENTENAVFESVYFLWLFRYTLFQLNHNNNCISTYFFPWQILFLICILDYWIWLHCRYPGDSWSNYVCVIN